ncbi:MAG: methyltransferase [Bacteroidetes bacterium]|nr:methyltransferase [Bacteroidota bacterium]
MNSAKADPHIFHFKEFSIKQKNSAMKVGIDGVLLGAWTKVSNCHKILDIGTGTGLLALMIAQQSPSLIDAVEMNELAFHEAKQNTKESKWHDRISIYHSSFQEFAKSTDATYDLIISNPPYHQETVKSGIESRIASRSSSFLELRELLYLSKKLMHKDSRMSFIYPYARFKEIQESCQVLGLYMNRVCFVKPNPNKDIHRVLVELQLEKKKMTESRMIIENEEHLNYTEEFKELTKDFYLNF